MESQCNFLNFSIFVFVSSTICLDWRGFIVTHLKDMRNCSNGIRIIVVNWGELSCDDYICLAAFACKAVGTLMGHIFLKLYEANNTALANNILIGHSLGARIFAYAAQYVRDNLASGSPNSKIRLIVCKFNTEFMSS